jgi:hypothetical protein
MTALMSCQRIDNVDINAKTDLTIQLYKDKKRPYKEQNKMVLCAFT